MGTMFDTAFRRFSAAFERRADEVYGANTGLIARFKSVIWCDCRSSHDPLRRHRDR